MLPKMLSVANHSCNLQYLCGRHQAKIAGRNCYLIRVNRYNEVSAFVWVSVCDNERGHREADRRREYDNWSCKHKWSIVSIIAWPCLDRLVKWTWLDERRTLESKRESSFESREMSVLFVGHSVADGVRTHILFSYWAVIEDNFEIVYSWINA